jgi:hypothetical protein
MAALDAASAPGISVCVGDLPQQTSQPLAAFRHGLTDMVNFTRAKDAAASMALRNRQVAEAAE